MLAALLFLLITASPDAGVHPPLSAKAMSCNSIDLSWEPTTGYEYYVYRDAGSGFLEQLTGNLYDADGWVDTHVAPSTGYAYVVLVQSPTSEVWSTVAEVMTPACPTR